jgi:ABC-type anion transport system duplicated permease subunit
MVTKRQLGFFVVVVSLIGTIGIVGVDVLGAGDWVGFGPLQRTGIGLGLAALIVGFILIQLGDRPA